MKVRTKNWRERLGDFLAPSTRICEICGHRVQDVEVPIHYTNKGGVYVHPLHIILSTKGRQVIDSHTQLGLTKGNDSASSSK